MGDKLMFHGATSSRALKALRDGAPCSAAVTLLDGIVLARSGFHHSMNYRSVVVYGQATELTDDAEILAALQAFTEKLAPGRWQEIRPPTPQELKATAVFSLPLTEASAKVRTGPPVDDDPDYDLPVWAGVVPLWRAAGVPITDPRYHGSQPAPLHPSHLGRDSAP
jgi:nitroimidazol reductase NimA-like FMN-containing flavoprotein (pyridoxamine 5'-phosphate oxidase superfamily)